MDFELTDDQRMLADTARDFATKSSPVERARALRDDPIGWSPDVWKEMGDLGWLSVPFPESVGGFGGSFLEVGLIAEQLGKQLVPEPYLGSVALGGMALYEAGDADQHEQFLAPMIAGERVLALAWAERRSRFSAERIETRARPRDGGWRLSGEKVWVLDGHRADHLIVSARTESGVTLFVVDPGASGVSVQRVNTIDGRKAAMVVLDDVPVGDDRRLGKEGGGASVLSRVLDYGATTAVSEGLGVCQQALDMTVEYLNTREQFGVKIGTFQALQHRAVEMFVETELLRSIATAAMVKATDADEAERRQAVSTAKYQLAVAGKMVTQNAIQLHGGIGVTDEADIGLYFKRMHALNTICGDEEHHVGRFAASARVDEPEGRR